jgi:hypothetical protein
MDNPPKLNRPSAPVNLVTSENPARELELLILSRYPIVCLDAPEEDQAEKLLRVLSGRLCKIFVRWRIDEGLFITDDRIPVPNTATPADALAYITLSRISGLFLMTDLHRYLDDPKIARRMKDAAHALMKRDATLFLVGRNIRLDEDLQHSAAHFELKLPDKPMLKQAVLNCLSDLQRRMSMDISLDESGWRKVLNALAGLTLPEAERAISRVVLKNRKFGNPQIQDLLNIKKELWMREGILEYLSSDDAMSSIGGMPNLKRWLLKRKGAFDGDAEAFGVPPPKGILLTGIPGCGKSLAAKAVANEWGLPLLRLDPSRLFDKFIGESEKNLEKALQTAEIMSPCVLFIDELEKGFSYAQSSDADGGLSRRLFGTFLTWMQEKRSPVFLFATSNDISVLPPELLRKGRFDEIFFVDLPALEVRRDIWVLHLTKRRRDPKKFDLDVLVRVTEGFSGAEIEQVLVNALYSAYSARQELSTAQIIEEIQSTVPLSVSMKERVDALREWAQRRAIFV